MNRIILFILIFLSGSLFAQSDLLQKAEEYYKKADYDKAIAQYDSLLNQGYFSADLYYNLGNAYYKKGDWGLARLYYEKALKWSPGDKDISHNINLINKKIDSEIAQLPDFFLLKWWENFTNMFSLNIWLFLVFIFALALVGSIITYWLANDDKKHKMSFRLIPVFFLLFIISFLAAYTVNNRIYHNKYAVLLQDQAVYAAPDSRSEKLYELKAGEKVKLQDSLSTWYKVQLPNKEISWIKKETLKRI